MLLVGGSWELLRVRRYCDSWNALSLLKTITLTTLGIPAALMKDEATGDEVNTSPVEPQALSLRTPSNKMAWQKRLPLLSAAALSLVCHAESFMPMAGRVMQLRSPATAGFVARAVPIGRKCLEAGGMHTRVRGLSGVRMVTQEMAEAAQQVAGTLQDGSLHLAFADQGSNLAGKFFQASLLPYLGFLYALQQDANSTPKMANFGFRYLLLFVIATIPTGIISKVGAASACVPLNCSVQILGRTLKTCDSLFSVQRMTFSPTPPPLKTAFGVSLADVDWLHGSAEALLTVTNLLIVYGFRQTMGRGDPSCMDNTIKNASLAILAAVALVAATGITQCESLAALYISNQFHEVDVPWFLTSARVCLVPAVGFEAHTPFLAGIGNLPASFISGLGFHAEPANALSIPTWAIHFSSVYEWMFAMGLVWK